MRVERDEKKSTFERVLGKKHENTLAKICVVRRECSWRKLLKFSGSERKRHFLKIGIIKEPRQRQFQFSCSKFMEVSKVTQVCLIPKLFLLDTK